VLIDGFAYPLFTPSTIGKPLKEIKKKKRKRKIESTKQT